MPAQIKGIDMIVRTKRIGDPVPVARMVEASMNQRGLPLASPIPTPSTIGASRKNVKWVPDNAGASPRRLCYPGRVFSGKACPHIG